MHDTLNVEMDYVGLRGGLPGFIVSGIYSLGNIAVGASVGPISSFYNQAQQAESATKGQQQLSNFLGGNPQGLPWGP
jgi:hypothetical protein